MHGVDQVNTFCTFRCGLFAHYTTYVSRVWCKKDQQTSEEKSLNDLQRFSKVLEKHGAAKICAHILEISRVQLRNGHIVVPDQISIRPEAEKKTLQEKWFYSWNLCLLVQFFFSLSDQSRRVRWGVTQTHKKSKNKRNEKEVNWLKIRKHYYYFVVKSEPHES